jgi:hypothetical protein
MSSSLTEVINHGDLDLNIVGAGGAGASGLSSLVTELKDSKSIEATKTVLASYIRTLNPETAAITEYQTGPISAFAPELKSPEFSLFNQIITEYFFAWQLNATWLNRVRDYLAGLSDVDPTDRQVVERAYQTIRKRTFAVTAEARRCRDKYQELVSSLTRGTRATSPTQTRRFVDAINSQLSSELKSVRTSEKTPDFVASVAITNAIASFGNEAVTATKQKCSFDTDWLNFSEFSSLPLYPFNDPIVWSDPLGQSPLNFLYARVEGKAIVSARFYNPQSHKDIVVFSPPASGAKFEGLLDLSSDPSNRPIDLVVETKSGRRFTFPAWR